MDFNVSKMYNENIGCLYDDLNRVLHRHRYENDLHLCSIIGILETLKSEFVNMSIEPIEIVFEEEGDEYD